MYFLYIVTATTRRLVKKTRNKDGWRRQFRSSMVLVARFLDGITLRDADIKCLRNTPFYYFLSQTSKPLSQSPLTSNPQITKVGVTYSVSPLVDSPSPTFSTENHVHQISNLMIGNDVISYFNHGYTAPFLTISPAWCSKKKTYAHDLWTSLASLFTDNKY